MAQKCPINSPCADAPVANISAEAPDVIQRRMRWDGAGWFPPLGSGFRSRGPGHPGGGPPVGGFVPDAQDPDAQDPDAQDPDAQDPDAQDPDAQDPDAQDPEEAVAALITRWFTDAVDQWPSPGDGYPWGGGPADVGWWLLLLSLFHPQIAPHPGMNFHPNFWISWLQIPLGNISLFGNSIQEAEAGCPSGPVFSGTIGANRVLTPNPVMSNRMALSLARHQALSKRFCLTALPGFICANVPFSIPVFTVLPGIANPQSAISWEVVAGALPPGVNIAPVPGGGMIRRLNLVGTATGLGVFNFTLQAGGSFGTTHRNYTVTVGELEPASQVFDLCQHKEAFVEFDLPGFEVTSWQLIGELPEGLTFDNGRILGRPETLTDSPVTFQVQANTAAGPCRKPYAVLVVEAEITTDTLPDGEVGEAYSQEVDVDCLDMSSDFAEWSIVSGELPPGLTLDPTGPGLIHGTPTETGEFTFTVKAKDEDGSAERELSIEITADVDYEWVWWNMEESALSDRQGRDNDGDPVMALPVVLNGSSAAAGSVPGIVENGVILQVDRSEPGSGGFDHATLRNFLDGMTVDSDEGATLVGWFRYGSPFSALHISNMSVHFRIDVATLRGFRIRNIEETVLGDEFMAFPWPAQFTWHFFVMEFFKVGAQWKLALELNRSGNVYTVDVAGPGGATFTAIPELRLENNGSTDAIPPSTVRYDEVALFDTLLTGETKDYLYNGGNGRTIPISPPS